jgi:hypothetical protein
MSVNEVMLIILLKNFKTKQQQALVLQKYVLQYGALSQEAGIKVREILAEVEE